MYSNPNLGIKGRLQKDGPFRDCTCRVGGSKGGLATVCAGRTSVQALGARYEAPATRPAGRKAGRRFSNRPTKAMPVAVGILLVLLLASCGIFEPRKSQEPPAGAGATYVLPQEPGLVISNMVNVVNELQSVEYQDLFTDDFEFVPDPRDVLTLENYYPGIFDDWGKAVEVSIGERLLDRITGALLAFEDTLVVFESESDYQVAHKYKLEILEEYWKPWKKYRGQALFYMRKEPSDNLWYIYRWEDYGTEATDSVDGTWGMLKGVTRATT
jgi:hypothetical protein